MLKLTKKEDKYLDIAHYYKEDLNLSCVQWMLLYKNDRSKNFYYITFADDVYWLYQTTLFVTYLLHSHILTIRNY